MKRFIAHTPPADALDHVDLGDGASERAHHLTASATSGTNMETCLTRRYTYQRTAGGEGTVSYQILVDRADLTTDGTVRVRFQEDSDGRNYDPSIADVWSIPATAG